MALAQTRRHYALPTSLEGGTESGRPTAAKHVGMVGCLRFAMWSAGSRSAETGDSTETNSKLPKMPKRTVVPSVNTHCCAVGAADCQDPTRPPYRPRDPPAIQRLSYAPQPMISTFLKHTHTHTHAHARAHTYTTATRITATTVRRLLNTMPNNKCQKGFCSLREQRSVGVATTERRRCMRARRPKIERGPILADRAATTQDSMRLQSDGAATEAFSVAR